jgi:hypothetical protein
MSSNKADQSPEPESRPRVLVLGGGLVGKFGGSITVIGPDFKPVVFSTIQSSSFKWPLGLAIDSKNNAWSPATSAARYQLAYHRSDGLLAVVVPHGLLRHELPHPHC